MESRTDGDVLMDPLLGPPQHSEASIAHLRESDPVLWVPGLDVWFVTRHEDVRLLFADSRLTADPRVYEGYQPPSEGDAARWLSELPFRARPSDSQMGGRRLVSAALTPRAVERMDRRVREVVEEFSAPLHGRRGVVDLVAEFTAPVTATVIARILGVPQKSEDEIRFRQLARRATRSIRPILTEEKRRKTERAGVEISEYVLGLVTERREAPREDMISDLVRASGTGAAADLDDIVRVVAALVAAGTGTTSLAATRALRALMKHPDQLALLRREPSLLADAVHELLRYDSGVFGMPRYVLEDFDLRGRSLRKGQLVVLSIMGANRDPRVFPDPDRLDLRRETKEAVTFGRGPHYCIGANLALAQLRAIVEAALDFLPPDARVLEDQVRWSKAGVQSQIKSLPTDFGA
jgi:hypothetical protein